MIIKVPDCGDGIAVGGLCACPSGYLGDNCETFLGNILLLLLFIFFFNEQSLVQNNNNNNNKI